MGWSSYPPEHKRSFFRAVALYALLMGAGGAYAWSHASEATKLWEARVPHAVAEIRTVYDTPQITDAAPSFSNENSVTPPGQGEGYVAIVMTDAGISEASTTRALDDLPAPVALAFSPYAPNLQDWLKKAASSKRDSLILLPMEPGDYPLNDPGPQALLSRLSAAENKAHLDWVLEQAAGTVGAMNFMGDGFLGDDRNTGPVFAALHDRNTMFIENTSGAAPLAEDAAKTSSLPYLAADARIDAKATELQIKQQLLNLETLARKRGYALGVAEPYPVTFNILNDWAASLERRGIKLVPLETVWKTKVQHEKAAAAQQPQQQQPQTPPQQPENGQ